MRKRKLLSMLAVVAVLLVLFLLGIMDDGVSPAEPLHEGTWYFAKNAVECQIGEGKIYQDNLHSKEGQTLLGVYTESDNRIEAHLAGVGGVEVLRELFLVETNAGQVLQDGDGNVYFYREALAALAALEAAETESTVGLIGNTPAPSSQPVGESDAPSDKPGSRAMPGLEEPSSGPEPAAVTKSGGNLVWIPQSGSKYHSTSTCSGMKNPTQVSKAEAESRGYTPCKRCY